MELLSYASGLGRHSPFVDSLHSLSTQPQSNALDHHYCVGRNLWWRRPESGAAVLRMYSMYSDIKMGCWIRQE